MYWFNRSSLENEREFELIGILLGVAIYNGVILDVRFPHVVYKKLMQQSVGLADLKLAFPNLGNNMQQLLDYADADGVEPTFGLCMQAPRPPLLPPTRHGARLHQATPMATLRIPAPSGDVRGVWRDEELRPRARRWRCQRERREPSAVRRAVHEVLAR